MDKRVDAYIAKAAPFAQPVLVHLRALVHQAIPEVQESIKWGFPHFEYHGIVCSMAAFKAHCAFGFWRGEQVVPPADSRQSEAMGQLGRITGLDDLPAKRILLVWLKTAAKLNVSGEAKASKKTVKTKPALEMPSDFAAALSRQAKAKRFFAGLSPSQQREYIEWISTAKREATRQQRVQTAVEWLAEHKRRNWKYEAC